MMPKFGGLLISRKPTESLTITYPGGFEIEVTLLRIVSDVASVIFERKTQGEEPLVDRMEMEVKAEIELPSVGSGDSVFSLHSLEGGRCMFRILASDSIRVLRTELLQPKIKRRRFHVYNHSGGSRKVRRVPTNDLEDGQGEEIA